MGVGGRQVTWTELPYLYEANLDEARSLLSRLRRIVNAKIAALTRTYYRLLSPRQRAMLLGRPREEVMRLITRSARTGRLFGMWISARARAYAREIARERRLSSRIAVRLEQKPETLTLEATIETLREMKELADDASRTLARLGRRRIAEVAAKISEDIAKLIAEKEALKPPPTMWRITYAVNYAYHREYFTIIGQAWSTDKNKLEDIQEELMRRVREHAEEEIGYSLDEYPQYYKPEKGIKEPGIKEISIFAEAWYRFPEHWIDREEKVIRLPAAWYDAKEEATQVPFDPSLVETYEIRKEDLTNRMVTGLEAGKLDEL